MRKYRSYELLNGTEVYIASAIDEKMKQLIRIIVDNPCRDHICNAIKIKEIIEKDIINELSTE